MWRGDSFYSDPSENRHYPFPLEMLLQVPEEPEEPQTPAASPSGSLCWARAGRGPGTRLPQADLAILDRLPGTWKAKGAWAARWPRGVGRSLGLCLPVPWAGETCPDPPSDWDPKILGLLPLGW